VKGNRPWQEATTSVTIYPNRVKTQIRVQQGVPMNALRRTGAKDLKKNLMTSWVRVKRKNKPAYL
jgi:hypothetical protein